MPAKKLHSVLNMTSKVRALLPQQKLGRVFFCVLIHGSNGSLYQLPWMQKLPPNIRYHQKAHYLGFKMTYHPADNSTPDPSYGPQTSQASLGARVLRSQGAPLWNASAMQYEHAAGHSELPKTKNTIRILGSRAFKAPLSTLPNGTLFSSFFEAQVGSEGL